MYLDNIRINSKTENEVNNIENFDNWVKQEIMIGSGKGKKVWLINPKNPDKQGWFKYVKKTLRKNPDGSYSECNSYENFSEKLAELIANTIGMKNAHIDLGIYENEIGCFSYNINKPMEEIVSLITKKYPKYNEKLLYDEQNKIYYSIQMILSSLNNKKLEKDFFKILIFDYIIGNSDRHSNNRAIVRKDKDEFEIGPLYDNGSSLCAYVYEGDIEKYFQKDKLKMNSLVRTKSKSMIKIDEKDKKKPTHLEVIKYLHKNFYDETNEFVNTVINKLDENKIENLVEQVNEMSYNRKRLLKKYLKLKIEDLKEVYGK